MNKIKEDINATIKMINSHHHKNHHDKMSSAVPKDAGSFLTYSKVFPFSNEEIKCYYKKFNYDGNILTVTGSGDNLLHSILMGSKDNTMFDINKLTRYFVLLKIAAIKKLDINEFISYFSYANDPGYPEMHYEIFKKFESSLDEATRQYWNAMYERFDIGKKMKFQQGFFYLDGDYSNNAYLIGDNYEKLKKNLEEQPTIRIIDKDLLLLTDEDLDKIYSAIFLSNIYDYVEDSEYFKIFLENKLIPKLEEGGKILYDYSWEGDKLPPYRGRGYATIQVEKCLGEKAFVYTKRKKQKQ